jgi:hypothetical protein
MVVMRLRQKPMSRRFSPVAASSANSEVRPWISRMNMSGLIVSALASQPPWSSCQAVQSTPPLVKTNSSSATGYSTASEATKP